MNSVTVSFNTIIGQNAGLWSRRWSRKESEIFGWSRSRIFLSDSTPGIQLDQFLHHTPKLGIPVEMVQFLLKLLLKQSFFAVCHDFH